MIANCSININVSSLKWRAMIFCYRGKCCVNSPHSFITIFPITIRWLYLVVEDISGLWFCAAHYPGAHGHRLVHLAVLWRCHWWPAVTVAHWIDYTAIYPKRRFSLLRLGTALHSRIGYLKCHFFVASLSMTIQSICRHNRCDGTIMVAVLHFGVHFMAAWHSPIVEFSFWESIVCLSIDHNCRLHDRCTCFLFQWLWPHQNIDSDYVKGVHMNSEAKIIDLRRRKLHLQGRY